MTHLFSPKGSYIHLSPFSFLSSSITSINIPLWNLKSFFFHSRKPVSSAKPGKGSDCNRWKSVLFTFNLLFFPLQLFWFGNDLQAASKHPLSLSIITWPFFYSVSSSLLKHFSKGLSFYFQYFPHGSAVTGLAQDPLQGMKLTLNTAKPFSQPKA